MKFNGIHIEHRYKNRFLGSYAFSGSKERIYLGSSPFADVRLLGEGVNGMHAFIEFDGKSWSIFLFPSPSSDSHLLSLVFGVLLRLFTREIWEPISIDSYHSVIAFHNVAPS